MTFVEELRRRLSGLGFDRLWEVERDGRLSLVVGNSKALWPVFRPILETSEESDPLDRYIERALAPLSAHPNVVRIDFAHDDPAPPIQRIASGAAQLSIAPCAMVIDDEIGLWIALRAVIDTDLPAAPIEPSTSPCTGCSAPCRPALDAAMATRPLSMQGVRANWKAWLAIRDACPFAKRARYSDDQIAYHYRGERWVKK